MDPSLCTLCASTFDDEDGHVTVRVTSGHVYKYHTACFDKVGRGLSTEKLKLASLGIYTETGRVVDVERRDAARRCCLVDCLGKSDGWYGVSCSRCDATHIHKACYESKEESWLSLVRAQRSNKMNDATLRKAMFSSKYDIIRMACPCRCGIGFFRVDQVADEDLTRRRITAPPKTSPQNSKPPRQQAVLMQATRRGIHTKPYHTTNANTSVRAEAIESSWPPEDLAGLPPIDPSICPILRVRMLHPVKCSDGFEYEEEALRNWLCHFGTSPISCLPASLIESF